MRCIDCDVELTDFEATRKRVDNGEYIDLCNNCFSPISDFIEVKERWNLFTEQDIREEPDSNDREEEDGDYSNVEEK